MRSKGKQKSVSKLKKELDRVFSLFIRLRGADSNGMAKCVSCGAVHHYSELQAGHFYRRQHLGTRWNENNVWPQCFACNVWRRGNYASYARFMYARFTQLEMDELDLLHRQSPKITKADLEDMIEKYTNAM